MPNKVNASNHLIEERDERTRKRKKIKRKMDSIIGLSYPNNEHEAVKLAMSGNLTGTTARLLDEGYCDNGFVIKKGTLEKYLNGQNQYVRGWELSDDGWTQTPVLNLTPDFVGTVNLGHQDFATFPFILGEWNREDLKLVDIENDRKGLDIDMRIDDESMFVKELKRQNHDIGVSAEFWYHINEEDTQNLYETLDIYVPVIDEIFIFAYGLVGECGNVNSSGLELKGEHTMPEETKELAAETTEVPFEDVTAETIEQVELAEDVSEAVEAAEEEVITEEVEEVIEEEVEEAEEGEEAVVEETIELQDGDEDESEEAEAEDDVLTEALAIINDLKGQVETLSAQIASLTSANDELKKTNRRLSGKLKTEKDKKERFLQNARGLSVELLPNEGEDTSKPNRLSEEEVARRKYLLGDGIGEE